MWTSPPEPNEMESKATADDVVQDSTAMPHRATSQPVGNSQKGNAFTELMKPKPKRPAKEADHRTRRTMVHGRDGLKAYTIDPESFPANRVIYYDEKFVVINDLFPKATVHLLILPRDEEKNVQRPQEAFDDPVFLKDCLDLEKKVRRMAAEELRRKVGRYSSSEQARRDAMEAEDIPDKLPSGRDWDKEIMTGTHANPSMTHLHIHVLSRDLHSECMTKTNHYKSFTTDFLIQMHEYPLAEEDSRRQFRRFPEDMLCWRCGKNFGNKMARLKEHLEVEFEEWKTG